MNKLTEYQKKQILDLYFNSNDNNIQLIANVVGVKYHQVSSFIKIELMKGFENNKSNLKIFHSKINK